MISFRRMFASVMAFFIASIFAQTLLSCGDDDCVEVPESQLTVLLQQKHSLAVIAESSQTSKLTGVVCSSSQTNANSDGGGNAIYLDRHDISCGSNQVLSQWKLNRPTSNQFRFDYSCCSLNQGSGQQVATSCAVHRTTAHDDGGGDSRFLDRHDLSCGSDQVMSQWKMEKPNPSQIQFRYTCCSFSQPVELHCTPHQTTTNDDGNGDSRFLDRHDLSCGSGSVISQWKLSRPSSNRVRFDYTCCSVAEITTTTTTTTSCNGNSCKIWGDPHVSGFDNGEHEFPGYLGLLSFGSREEAMRPIDVNMYEEGDFWLMRSAELHIQSRFAPSKDFVPDRPAVGALAISGPLLDNKLLHIQPLDMAVSWGGQQLSEAPLDENLTSGNLHVHSHEGPEGARVLEVQLPKGVHLRAVRFPHHIDATITLPTSFNGKVDGLCGNRNGVADDDAQEIVAKRMHGIVVSPHERLLAA